MSREGSYLKIPIMGSKFWHKGLVTTPPNPVIKKYG